MCSLTLLLFAFVSLLLIETTNFQENINFCSVYIDDGSVVLGGFLVENKFSDRSELP